MCINYDVNTGSTSEGNDSIDSVLSARSETQVIFNIWKYNIQSPILDLYRLFSARLLESDGFVLIDSLYSRVLCNV